MSRLTVYKSSAVEWLDDFFSAENLPQAYENAENLLQSNSLAGITAQLAQGDTRLSEAGAEDFDAHWLADSSRLASKDVERVMRHGYAEAIKIARSHADPVPIETFWVTTGPGDAFEMHVCDGKGKVTVFVLIPLDRQYGSNAARNSRSWVVRAGGLRDGDVVESLDSEHPPVVKIQVSGPAMTEG